MDDLNVVLNEKPVENRKQHKTGEIDPKKRKHKEESDESEEDSDESEEESNESEEENSESEEESGK